LPALPPGCRALRLTTNQEVYWDRVAVAWSEPCPEVIRHTLDLAAAEVRDAGFPRRTTGPQRVPAYDYTRRAPLWDTRWQAGWYTELGPATELVAAADDAVAVFGAGEEIHLEFSAPVEDPPAGWSRSWVLSTRGWCKDMDLYTADGDTIGPLPSSGRDPAHRERLHARYNTRYRSGR
jgi:hypothetical protein